MTELRRPTRRYPYVDSGPAIYVDSFATIRREADLSRVPADAVRSWVTHPPTARGLGEFAAQGRYLEVDLADRPLTVACVYIPKGGLPAHLQRPGHFWMTLLEGEHVSTDIAVVDGEPCWWRHSTGVELGGGVFDYWTVHAAGNAAVAGNSAGVAASAGDRRPSRSAVAAKPPKAAARVRARRVLVAGDMTDPGMGGVGRPAEFPSGTAMLARGAGRRQRLPEVWSGAAETGLKDLNGRCHAGRFVTLRGS